MRQFLLLVSLVAAGVALWVLRPRPVSRADVVDAGVLLGVVLGPDGGGVAGVEVRGYPLHPVGLLACVDPDGGAGSLCPPPMCLVGDEFADLAAHPIEPGGPRSVTRADGTFLLPLVEPGAGMRVIASAAGVGFGSASGEAGERVEVTLVEPEPRRVQGRVLDENGQPRAGVPVLAFDDDGVRLLRVVTDATGHFTMSVPDADWSIVAALPGLAPSVLLDAALDSDTDNTLVVGPWLTVSGQVTMDGTPVADADIVARADCTYSQRADANGRFAFHLSPGAWHLGASAPQGRASSKLTVAPGIATPPVVLSLGRPSGVGGVVVDGAGRPIATAGAWCAGRRRRVISLDPQDDPDVVRDVERVDAGGDFIVREYGAGECDLVTVAPGYVKQVTPVKWREGEVAQVKVVLQAGAPVTLRAVSASGTPLIGIDVLKAHCPPGGGRCTTTLLGSTDEDGRLTTSALPAGVATLALGGAGLTETSVQLTAPSTTEVVVAVPSAVRVAGSIVDAHGSPAPQVRVLVEGPRGFATGDTLQVLTDEDGVFRAECPRPGAWRLTATRSDDHDVTTAVAGTTFKVTDENFELRRLQLGPGLTLSGTVRDPAGGAVANARVWARPRRASDEGDGAKPSAVPGDGAQALSDATGAFVLRGLEARTYLVWAEAERARAVPSVTQGGSATAVTLVLDR